MVQRFIYIFLIAFVLNALWEYTHAIFYIHYEGGAVYDIMLFRATLFDASVITLFAYPFLAYSYLKNKLWLMVLLITIFAIGFEVWALETGRWAYIESMPIVPVIEVGFTPIIQLGLLAYISVWGANWVIKFFR